MSLLLQIKPFLQPCIHAIASVINAQVTIVDESLARICGTGYYESARPPQQMAGSFFEHVMHSGLPGFITDKENEYCRNCNRQAGCNIKAEMGYPISYHDRIIGVIGISAFTDTEAENLLQNYNKFAEFVKYISILIVSQLQNAQHIDLLRTQLSAVSSTSAHPGIIGNSVRMQQLFVLADRVSASDSTILITGDSGSGKEELAKYIHSHSSRKDGPLISINCGAIPDSLVESELFGYEGGSFTGAKKEGSIGKFELADKGTLFLDEVGELSLPAQSKLLRVLQERKIERIGGKTPIPIDIRIIAATNKDLGEMVKEHTFRQDLFYRLNVIPMKMPSLSERGSDDIMQLSEYFLDHYNKKLGKRLIGFDPRAEVILRNYSWPGNVRELKNMMEYLVNVSPGDLITAEDLPSHLKQTQSIYENPGLSLNDMVSDYEKSVLEAYLKKFSGTGNKSRLAGELGISQATLYRKLSQYDLL